jgi:DNA processing protein
MTNYGSLVLHTLIPPLADAHVTIVSGLALGIDARAHRETLTAGGHTIAVLGGGIDNQSIAPRANYKLAQDILTHGGALISEYPPGTQPTTYSFPERNRIIAALSRATLVVEAATGSGSLITAQAAMEYGKEVCGVPHPIHSITGGGVNELLKQGAHMITEASELLSIMHIEPKQTKHIPVVLTREERAIYALLQTGEQHIDDIIRSIDAPNAQTMSLVTILEMKGVVKNMGNMTYIAL